MPFRHALAALLVLPAALPAAAPPAGLDPDRVQALLRRLDHDRFEVRQRADEALRACGRAVVPCLRSEIERARSLEVRWRLGRIVHDLTMDERVGPLVQLLGDGDPQTRERADWALRRGGAAVVPLLRKELRGDLSAD